MTTLRLDAVEISKAIGIWLSVYGPVPRFDGVAKVVLKARANEVWAEVTFPDPNYMGVDDEPA